MLKDARCADLALALYCLNPASVFMSSIYTESLFSGLAFGGMLSLHGDRPFHAAVCFGVASACRSNGERLPLLEDSSSAFTNIDLQTAACCCLVQ